MHLNFIFFPKSESNIPRLLTEEPFLSPLFAKRPLLLSFTVAVLFLPGSPTSLFRCQPPPIWMVILIIMWVALSTVRREAPTARAACHRPSLEQPGGLGRLVFPGAPAPRCARSPWVPAGRGRGKAGVPNDSPTLQPGEVLAPAPLPQCRWGSLWSLLGFKTFPDTGRRKTPCAGRLGPPPGAAATRPQILLAPSLPDALPDALTTFRPSRSLRNLPPPPCLAGPRKCPCPGC